MTNQLCINDDKVIYLKFTFKRNDPDFHNHTKFLGIIIESGLGWGSHIDMLSKKISKSLFIIRSLRSQVDLEVLLMAYYAYINSHLTYGTLLWGNHCTAVNLFKLQKKGITTNEWGPL